MTTAPKLADVAMTPEAATIVGETLDNFRHLARKPGFPSSVKIGGVRFYKREDLKAWNQNRAAVNKLRRAVRKTVAEVFKPDAPRKAK